MNTAWMAATGQRHRAPGPRNTYVYGPGPNPVGGPLLGDFFKDKFKDFLGNRGSGDDTGDGGEATDPTQAPLNPIPGHQLGATLPFQEGWLYPEQGRAMLHNQWNDITARTPNTMPNSGNNRDNDSDFLGLFASLFNR